MRPHTLSVRYRFVTITSGSTRPLSSNRFPVSEHDTQRLRILLAGDGSGKSDIGGGEFCTICILRLGGDSEMFIGWGWRWLVVTVVAMAGVWLLCGCFWAQRLV